MKVNTKTRKLSNVHDSKASNSTKWRKIQNGEIWKPKKAGEKIEGLLTSQQTGFDKKNSQEFPSVTIVGAQTWSVRTDRHQLKPLNRIPRGTPLRLTYLGKRKVNNLNPMMEFDIEIPADVEEIADWTEGRFDKKSSAKSKSKSRK